MKRNTIIEIGYLGCKICYLNVPKEEAIKRYCETTDSTEEEIADESLLDEVEFNDEFESECVWFNGELKSEES